MKTITIGEKTITLDIGDELRVKDLRKISPIISNQEKGKEMDMILQLVEVLGGKEQAEIVDEMNIEEFTKFSEEMVKVIDTQAAQKKIVK